MSTRCVDAAGDLYLVYAADGQVGYFLGRRSQRRSGMSRVHPAPMRIEECQRRVRLGRLTHRAAGTLLLLCSSAGNGSVYEEMKPVDVVTGADEDLIGCVFGVVIYLPPHA